MPSTPVRRLSLCAVLTAAALALSFGENLLPLAVLLPLPGLRLGLANLVTVYALCRLSVREAAWGVYFRRGSPQYRANRGFPSLFPFPCAPFVPAAAAGLLRCNRDGHRICRPVSPQAHSGKYCLTFLSISYILCFVKRE